jgi:hypothetical protein
MLVSVGSIIVAAKPSEPAKTTSHSAFMKGRVFRSCDPLRQPLGEAIAHRDEGEAETGTKEGDADDNGRQPGQDSTEPRRRAAKRQRLEYPNHDGDGRDVDQGLHEAVGEQAGDFFHKFTRKSRSRQGW